MFCTRSFVHKGSLLFVMLEFLEMVILGSSPKMLVAKTQQSLSVDILVLCSVHGGRKEWAVVCVLSFASNTLPTSALSCVTCSSYSVMTSRWVPSISPSFCCNLPICERTECFGKYIQAIRGMLASSFRSNWTLSLALTVIRNFSCMGRTRLYAGAMCVSWKWLWGKNPSRAKTRSSNNP